MTTSLFDRAACQFTGWTDFETGLRVLKVTPRNAAEFPGTLATKYHQYCTFIDGGRTVLLNHFPNRKENRQHATVFLDLDTGHLSQPLPDGVHGCEFQDGSSIAACHIKDDDTGCYALYDLATHHPLARIKAEPGWYLGEFRLLCSKRQAIVQEFQGRFGGNHWSDKCNTRLWLLDADAPRRLLLEADGYFVNHVMGCPTNPTLFSFDKWPTPKPTAKVEVVIHIRDLAGTFEKPLPQNEKTVRPGSIWGGQRDHYVWTPDGKCIASYFSPIDSTSSNHFDFGWWLSVLDWQSGKDLACEYPPERWNGHFQISPDSRYLCACGRGTFQYLFRVDLERLPEGWNEQILCRYPQTEHHGTNGEPFHMPFVLPDQSGVIFTAGWPGPEFGVYLAEWPRE